MTRIFALANQKGGVGKTTTAYHLARAAHRRGLKVLVIDIDPQGNLTSSLSRDDLDPDSPNLADVLSAQTPETMDDVLVPSLWEGVDLIPTTGETLPYVRNELIATQMGAESKLKKAIHSMGEGRYDLILVDCPPSIDQLTINALVASDAVLVVTHAARYSLDGIAHLIDSIQSLREHYNPSLDLAGLIVNQYEKQRNASQAWRLELTQATEKLGLTVYEPVVPKRTLIAETAENGETLDTRRGEDARHLVEIYDRYITKITGEA